MKILFTYFVALFSFSVYAASPSEGELRPEDFTCTDDTNCWQEAIDTASDNSSLSFGRVAGAARKTYVITDTIYLCNVRSGVIDGNGATMQWKGPDNKPMFLVVNGYHMRFKNFYIRSGNNSNYHKLDTVFEFTSARQSDTDAEIFCNNRPAISSSKNSLDHITAQGTVPNGLKYGVRFSERYSYDANNDMSTIVDSTFNNVMNAVVKVEHAQSHQHRLISVNGYGAIGNDGCYLEVDKGFASVIGGFQHRWGRANFCTITSSGPISLIDTNSENSNRMLEVGSPNDVASYPVNVMIQGGRFATNKLNNDGNVISFNRLGSLKVSGLRFKGRLPDGTTQVTISAQPGRGSAHPNATASVIVEGVTFYQSGMASDNWDVVRAKNYIELKTEGLMCSNTQAQVVKCRSPLIN